MYRFSTYKEQYRANLKLALPVVLTQLGQILTQFADNLMVGRYGGDDPPPPGPFIVPPHPPAGTTATPRSRCPHHPTPVLASLRQPLLLPGRAAMEVRNKKNRRFFGVFVKFLLLLHHIAVTTLYPRRNGLHAASASLLTREFR